MPKEINGVSLGSWRQARLPVLDTLSRLGVTASKSSISQWRGDSSHHTGGELSEKIECAKILQENNSFKKDSAYLKIASTGVRLRRYQKGPRLQTLSSRGLTTDMSDELDITQEQLLLTLRAMRTDVAYGVELLRDEKDIFDRTVVLYVQDHQVPTNKSKIATEVERTWNGTLCDFYRIISSTKLAVSAWVPYEMAFMRYFYQGRIARGSTLSKFDRFVLETFAAQTSFSHLSRSVKESTRVNVDNLVMTRHRNYIVHGNPINPRLER